MSSNRTPSSQMTSDEHPSPTSTNPDSLFGRLFQFSVSGAFTGIILSPLFISLQNSQLKHSQITHTPAIESNRFTTNMIYNFAKHLPKILSGSARAGAKKNSVVGERDTVQDGVRELMGNEKPSLIKSVVIPGLTLQLIDTVLTSASLNKNFWVRAAALIEKQGGKFTLPELNTNKEKWNAYVAGMPARTGKNLPTTLGLILQPTIHGLLPDTMSDQSKKVSTAFIIGTLCSPFTSVGEILLNEQLYTVEKDGKVSSLAKVLKDNKGLLNTVKGQLPPTMTWMLVIQIALQYTVPVVDEAVSKNIMPFYLKVADWFDSVDKTTSEKELSDEGEKSKEVSSLGETYRKVGTTFFNKTNGVIKPLIDTTYERTQSGPSEDADAAREKFEHSMGLGF